MSLCDMAWIPAGSGSATVAMIAAAHAGSRSSDDPMAAAAESTVADTSSAPEDEPALAPAEEPASAPADESTPVTGETIQFPPEPPVTRDTTVFPDHGQVGPPVAAAPLTPPPTTPAPPTPPPPPVVPPPVMPPTGGYTEPVAQGYGQQGYGQQYPPSAGFTPPAPYYPPAATTPVSSGSGIGVAALVVGILAVILSFSCFFFPFIPIVVAIAAGVLGIIGINQANSMSPQASKGMPVTGLILGGVALAVSVLFVVLLAVGSSANSGF